MRTQLIKLINKDLQLQLPETVTESDLQEKIALHINYLINNNFQQLVQLLYRIDINEARLKNLLKENPGENAGKIIAGLIIERQLQKIKTRASFKSNGDIPDAEKW